MVPICVEFLYIPVAGVVVSYIRMQLQGTVKVNELSNWMQRSTHI